MIGLGIGLGVGMQQSPGRRSPTSDEICAAIASCSVVRFAYQGSEITAEPYAVQQPDGLPARLVAVVLQATGDRHVGWEPEHFDISAMSGFGRLDATFMPSRAFKAIGEDAPLLCVIDFLQGSLDSDEAPAATV